MPKLTDDLVEETIRKEVQGLDKSVQVLGIRPDKKKKVYRVTLVKDGRSGSADLKEDLIKQYLSEEGRGKKLRRGINRKMRTYILKRLALTVPVLLGVSLLVFLFIHMIPGDPVEVMLGESASPADREALRQQYHLDEPLYVQLGYFFKELFTGELESIFHHEPAIGKVM